MSEIDVAKYAGHTPGPWQAKNAYEWGEIIGNIDGPDAGNFHYTNICQVDPHDTRTLEHLANARLIAAAPELLRQLTAERTAKEAALAELATERTYSEDLYKHSRQQRRQLESYEAELRKVREGVEPHIADLRETASVVRHWMRELPEHAATFTRLAEQFEQAAAELRTLLRGCGEA